MNSDLKILYGYPVYPSAAYGDVEAMNKEYLARLSSAGFDVEGFCLTLDPPSAALSFRELNSMWKRGDRKLLRMYERLEKVLESKDVLINASGINLHPRFVEQLSVFTVFQCFDDPENSRNLSKPAAAAYDLSLVGNVAEVETYKSWGVKNAEWTAIGLMHNIFDPGLTYEEILEGERDIDIFLMADKTAPWRRERLEKLEVAFPHGHFYGKGWAKGILPREMELQMLRRSKIGPNIHNSTGPINLRTFYLPANGVMQICDNKSHLSVLFELDKEVIGFDSVDECVELCRYFLSHDVERRRIAAEGWRRAMKDYTETSVFRRNVELIRKHIGAQEARRNGRGIALRRLNETKWIKELWFFFVLMEKVETGTERLIRLMRYPRRLPAKLLHLITSSFTN
ncbi:MAG TPA: glycosyltransferase [Candidatus Acidoferrales bacterium]|nr:glycosyltransferase [Candidatus Acidoferrales bacterium]